MSVDKGVRFIKMYENEREATRALNEIFLIKLMGGDPLKIEYYRKYLTHESDTSPPISEPIDDNDIEDINAMKRYLEK
jgi:hypothetical protein